METWLEMDRREIYLVQLNPLFRHAGLGVLEAEDA